MQILGLFKTIIQIMSHPNDLEQSSKLFFQFLSKISIYLLDILGEGKRSCFTKYGAQVMELRLIAISIRDASRLYAKILWDKR